MIGRTLGGRYIVEARVGGGGMAAVYRGVDSFLHRQVALKVLRSQFADDAEFVNRFRREARAAASLSHPNIVAVYDVGQEDPDCYYIVQEFVDGRTLKERIQQEGPLPVEEALGIAQQVLRGLGHAHAVGVVHRDVKPQNVLLTRDGRVKVTDFGIARAGTGATFVHTGAILGTAHYAAPEQVRGQPTDQRCDLYSTGVMLYEMLVGHPPFDGESPLAVAMQHVERPVPDIAAERPDLSEGVRAVLAHALAKSPEDRYSDSAEMAADIEAVLAGAPPRHAALAAAPGTADGAVDPGDAEQDVEEGPERQTRGGGLARLSAIAAGVILGLAVLAGGGVLAFTRLLNVRVVPVPAVVGQSLAGAEQAIAGAHLLVQVYQENSTQVPAGQIDRASPAPGTPVRQGTMVEIWQSLGPPNVTLPDLSGLTLAAAQTELGGMGLQAVAAPGKHYSATVPPGYVIASSPAAGASVAEGTSVSLQLSDGPSGIGIMPNEVGRTLQTVQADLAARQLQLGTVTSEPTGWPAGIVAATSPVAGAAAPAGSTADLTVSSGCVYSSPHTFQAGSTLPAAASGTSASGSAAGASTQAGMHEQVLIQDVGQPTPRLIYDQVVPPGTTFKVQLCWSSPQGAVWTWQENGAVAGSGTVVAAAGTPSGSGAGPASTSAAGPASAGGPGPGTPAAGSSAASSGPAAGGGLPSNPGNPGSAGLPAQSSTGPG